ncbi:uncharacterized protein EV420DRAFT_199154 [Desarmillaria tabescens]|uniref:Uncharacterized protein n=1 Tax=Armillaria tabescens TaxID=1929756 RepID=A0AA39J772_ARMTA|nr:uncharacterized protein EV420DRAFT_199154 [Desarmillaria tabescens]KAK0437422.1 hypothetical protein EV420DRAFT_199154 [Desarmillaria tabescens]
MRGSQSPLLLVEVECCIMVLAGGTMGEEGPEHNMHAPRSRAQVQKACEYHPLTTHSMTIVDILIISQRPVAALRMKEHDCHLATTGKSEVYLIWPSEGKAPTDVPNPRTSGDRVRDETNERARYDQGFFSGTENSAFAFACVRLRLNACVCHACVCVCELDKDAFVRNNTFKYFSYQIDGM